MVEFLVESLRNGLQSERDAIIEHVRKEIPGVKIRVSFIPASRNDKPAIDESWKIRAKNAGWKIS